MRGIKGLLPKLAMFFVLFFCVIILKPIQAHAVSPGSFTPSVPKNLSAHADSSSGIYLCWYNEYSPYNEKGKEFIIERKDGTGGSWLVITTAQGNRSDNIDTSIKPNTTYYYRVKAKTMPGYGFSGYETGYSNVACATTPSDSPYIPSKFKATTLSSSQIALSWVDNSPDETEFVIERRTDSGDTWAVLTTLPTGTTSYTDRGLKAESYYCYRIKTNTKDGDYGYSTEANTKTWYEGFDNNDSYATATVIDDNDYIKASIAVPRDEDYYKFIAETTGIYTVKGGGCAEVVLLDGNGNEYGRDYAKGEDHSLQFNSTLVSGKKYYLWVTHVSRDGIGDYEFQIIPPPVAPKELPKKVDVDKNKPWTIKFSVPVDENTLKDNIIVKDSKGNIIQVNITSSDGCRMITISPVTPYVHGGTYTLTIGTGLRSKQGKFLRIGTKQEFTIKN